MNWIEEAGVPLKPQKDLAIKTDRDSARRAEFLAAQEHWAMVDRDIADALGELPTDGYSVTIQRGGHDGNR